MNGEEILGINKEKLQTIFKYSQKGDKPKTSFTKEITKKCDDKLINFPIKGKVDGWAFRIDEISQGYYRVEGMDRYGRIVSRDGIDPDELLEQCVNDVKKIMKD
ncbi:hypothetical protein JR338_04905 [Chloroflexota bacterium]|nr:hypothetical protein JR338_04905 [Chloroflexota bacterium]